MRKYFGTDGVRGIANIELTPTLAFHLGRAGAFILKKHSLQENEKLRMIIGYDTRISKDLLANALAAGAMSVRCDVIDVGVIPTPGVAYLTKYMGADAGVVISASHNPMEYNGIKFFNSNGLKLDDSIEIEIEECIDNPELIDWEISREQVGEKIVDTGQRQKYINMLESKSDLRLDGLNIALDCANGASYKVAPELFRRLGAHVTCIGVKPDGININDQCGSTHTHQLCSLVKKGHFDCGFAYDGDADRLIAVDENGNEINGDQIMMICAKSLKEEGKLTDDTLVVTIMSNLGLHIAAKENGIKLEVTTVGDRYVLENMLEHQYSLGGEQSGHMIFLDHTTTGDGTLSSLMLANILKKTKQPMSELAKIMDIMPQVLVNARVTNENKLAYKKDEAFLNKISEIEEKLEGEGRVLIRPSGTEPLVRVMLEGKNEDEIAEIARNLAHELEEKYGK